ncbi:MAG: hypothetical protein ACFFC3_02155 [Candidatus Odinarchaeota archaeon]
MTEEKINSTEYLQKFTYRPYEGEFQPRWKRVLYLIRFELISTWRKSKFAKFLMVLLVIFNFFAIVIGTLLLTVGDNSMIRDGLNAFIANYMALPFDQAISSNSSPDFLGFEINLGLGIILIMVIGLAGSGLFADDKRGKVTEIYLSRLEKREYITGKIGAIIIYINIFVLVPLIITGMLYVQALEENHLDYLDFYMSIIAYSLLIALILGLLILTLSIFFEKRSYASLLFFLFFVIGGIIGLLFQQSDPDNEFLLLISPSNFMILLAYVCLGDFNLGIMKDSEIGFKDELILNNGVGLEYIHVLIVAFIYILICSLLLAYKIWRTTTEE